MLEYYEKLVSFSKGSIYVKQFKDNATKLNVNIWRIENLM